MVHWLWSVVIKIKTHNLETYSTAMRYLIALAAIVFSLASSAQDQLPTPRNIQATYDKKTRSANGNPGEKYWQNRGDYTLNVHYYPASRLLSGYVMIDYINYSPDTLRQILFKLYPNLYKTTTPRQARIAEADLGDGVSIDAVQVEGKSINISNVRIDGTNMWITVPPLYSGYHVHFRVDYHYTLNKGSHIRTGEIEPGAAFIAYFFPRIAVYDDIDGWNTFPYNGTQEFYNDFGHFTATILVPPGYIVWATGEEKNMGDNLSPEIFKRLQQA